MKEFGQTHISYRPDIDGLRAIAVLAVIFYHFEISVFSGGYIGVDIFFVISGYLITSIIYSEMIDQTFSMAKFYERRIRRLFPALIFVLLTTIVAGYLLLLPAHLESLSWQVVATTFFSSNFLFWQTTGYFDTSVTSKPLLHTWSLAVEEQFYITYPLLLLLWVRRLPGSLRIGLVTLTVASLAYSVFSVKIDRAAAFYLPMSRAWELGIGALVALGVGSRSLNQIPSTVLSFGGLLLIGIALFFYKEATPFPGLAALAPCIGTALVIFAGKRENIFCRLLEWKPIVFIGLLSYSLYLWHWPVYVFYKYGLTRDLLYSEQLFLLVITGLFSWVSWRWIEQPVRIKQLMKEQFQLYRWAVIGILIIIVPGVSGAIYKGFPHRFDEQIVSIEQLAAAPSEFRQQCFNLKADQINRDSLCVIGDRAVERDFIVWGDSHALAVVPGIHDAGELVGRSGYFFAFQGCPPLLGVERLDLPQKCDLVSKAGFTFLNRNPELRTVIMVGRWALSANGTRYPGEEGTPALLSPNGIEGNPEQFRQGLFRTVSALNAMNREVIFVEQVPEIGWDVPDAMMQEIVANRKIPDGPSLEEYRERQKPVESVLAELQLHFPVIRVSPAKVFCPDKSCLVEIEGRPVYQDDDHLAVWAARLLTNSFVEVLENQESNSE